MGYRSNVVFYIASPKLDDYRKILEEILNVSYQNKSEFLLLAAEQSVSKIIRKDDYDCLRNDEYVLIFINDWIKMPDDGLDDIESLINILEYKEIAFSLGYLEIGEDFHDIKTFEHSSLKHFQQTKDNCYPSFLNNNKLDISREIICENTILNDYLILGETNGSKS